MIFNKQNLRVIRTDVLDALKAVEKKHGVSFTLGNTRYSPTDFRVKLECFAVKDNSGKDVDAAKAAFESKAFRVGIKRTAYGKTFTHGRKTFKIVGINTRAPKYPIQAESINRGDRYKFPLSAIPANLHS